MQPTDLTFWTHWRKHLFPERSVRVNDAGKNCKTVKFFTWGHYVFEMCCNGTASLKQICFLGVVRKVSNRNTLSGETFALLKTVCYQCLNFVLWVTYCFITSHWLTHNQLSWNVLLIYCNLIGQLCLSGPSYSSRTVTY